MSGWDILCGPQLLDVPADLVWSVLEQVGYYSLVLFIYGAEYCLWLWRAEVGPLPLLLGGFFGYVRA